MSHEQLPQVSEAEGHVLRALWDCGPSTASALHTFLRKAGQDWARTTVITLLQRLEAKGYVSADKTGHAFCYNADVSREEMVQLRMAELADDLCEGQWGPLLLAFTKRERLTPESVAELQQLVDELSRRTAGGRKKSKKD